MFDFLDDVAKAAFNTVTIPLSAAKDVVTGDAMFADETATERNFRRLKQNIDDACDDLE